MFFLILGISIFVFSKVILNEVMDDVFKGGKQ
jgi:hypothetical protein